MFRALLQLALVLVLWMLPTFGVIRLIHGREGVLGSQPLSFLTSPDIGLHAPSNAAVLTFLICTMIVLPWAMSVAEKLDPSDDHEQLSFVFE